VHSFVAKLNKLLKKKNIDYLFIDEISMLHEVFYNWLLFVKKMKKIKIIISGHFKQLEPVNDRVKCDYENSMALYELVDGNMQNLTNCRRANKEYFDLTNPDTIMEIDTNIFGHEFQQRGVCFTNKKRIEVNTICMQQHSKKRSKKERLELPAVEYDGNSQDVVLTTGVPVISRKTTRLDKLLTKSNNHSIPNQGDTIKMQKKRIFNNEMFVISKISFSNQLIYVKNPRDEMCIPFQCFQNLFYVAFCITIHKSQGQTFDFPYSIHEWDKLNARLRYTSLSRATCKEIVHIV
jgi:ATP-dependent exoDNAse (exonuclease V) alpha subunit